MIKFIKIFNFFNKKPKYKVDQYLLVSNAPYLLIFHKSEKFLKYKENNKYYFEKYQDFSSQENKIFFTFPYGMSVNDVILYIKNEEKLEYGIDYIASGFMEGFFYHNKIKDDSIFKNLLFTSEITPNLDPNIYEMFKKNKK
jgi:hypothetical protein